MDSNLWKQRDLSPPEVAFKQVKEAIIDRIKDAAMINSYLSFGVMDFDENTGLAKILISTYRIRFFFSFTLGDSPISAFIKAIEEVQKSNFAEWFDQEDMTMWLNFLKSL